MEYLIEPELLHSQVRRWAESRGIRIGRGELRSGQVASFDGVSVTLNADVDEGELGFYLLHTIGSIAQWALAPGKAARVFDALRESKWQGDRRRLEQAIAAFQAFEELSSEYAVALLDELRLGTLAPRFSEFFRADLSAMSIFHRTGRLPDWNAFWRAWQRELVQGTRAPRPFAPRPIPAFQPIRIEPQEVVRGE